MVPATPPSHLGFLTVRQEAGGYVGGYLVTNTWGRPLEFRVSSAIRPNRVQQILYAQTLAEYLFGEVIGKTLVEKTATPVRAVFVDILDALSLRRSVQVPVLWVAPSADARAENWAAAGLAVRPSDHARGLLIVHPDHPDDVARAHDVVEKLASLDLSEPFTRIAGAIAEAQKIGALQRAG